MTLGDDRGPHCAQVIGHLMSTPPDGIRRIALPGNHEPLLLDFLANSIANAPWLEFGGLEIARSYGMREHPTDRGAR